MINAFEKDNNKHTFWKHSMQKRPRDIFQNLTRQLLVHDWLPLGWNPVRAYEQAKEVFYLRKAYLMYDENFLQTLHSLSSEIHNGMCVFLH